MNINELKKVIVMVWEKDALPKPSQSQISVMYDILALNDAKGKRKIY